MNLNEMADEMRLACASAMGVLEAVYDLGYIHDPYRERAKEIIDIYREVSAQWDAAMAKLREGEQAMDRAQ